MRIEDAPDAAALGRAARDAGVPDVEPPPHDFEQAFFALWNRFEHRLGREAPLLVTEWPAPLASLARLKPGDPRVAERMEWIVGGIELANGFAELTDAAEQRRRFEQDRAVRRARSLPEVPPDERFLAALEEGMPPAAGMALGIDRLVMLLAGAASLAEVLPFTWDER
jgi:lysyl-tRNA synthetase class 2